MPLPTFPIKPVVLPTVLSNQANGKLSTSILYDVPGGGKLIGLTYWYYTALKNEAAKAGIQLTYSPGGCYRTYQSQYNLFMSRYEPISYAVWLITPTSRRKTWNGGPSKYWRKKLFTRADGTKYYPATAAVPGTSNHGLGLAIDLALGPDPQHCTSLTTPAINWLYFNAPKYGFSWESQDEPWHIRYVAGDAGPK